MGVRWNFEEETPSLTLEGGGETIQIHQRKEILRIIRRRKQLERGEELRQKPSQGRVAECLRYSP
ncbi:hypothetical protein ACUWC3_28760, partial [Klebsiella pneumoniae]|uniref:hypothetical protein n=1 Tax=Klebsiella pneumoniae TaxID=573 RepID=UPI0040555490